MSNIGGEQLEAEVLVYPEDLFFPEEVTLFGRISFDFDDQGCFTVIFTEDTFAHDRSFFAGSIDIQTSTQTFDSDMAKLIDTIHQLRFSNYKSGAELQILIIDQLRLDFPNIVVDNFLQQSLLEVKES